MGKDADKQLWQYFYSHWLAWFPNLGSRSNFVKKSANLWQVKERILRRLAGQMGERPKAFVKQLLSVRRLVETVIGQLTECFHIEKVRACDL